MDKMSFDLPEGLNRWLRKEAFRRHMSKSALVAEFCAAGRSAAEGDVRESIATVVDALASGSHITPEEATCQLSAIVHRACQEQREHSESEWSKDANSD